MRPGDGDRSGRGAPGWGPPLMVPVPDPPGPRPSRQLVGAVVVLAVVITALVWLLHGPAVGLPLTGDTYQWVQHAHRAVHQPALLLADLDGFFRPSATWLLVVDRMVWGGFDAAGYRTTSLLLHGLSALMLALAGRRLDLGWPAAAAVAAVWAASPFTDESVLVVACRHELLLLLPWLLLILIWPRTAEQRWSGRQIAGVALLVLLAAMAKETWVVTPLLVAALELERTGSVRRAVIPTAAVAAAVVAYLAVYLSLFHNAKPYLEPGPHVVAMIPNMLASFLYLEPPMVDGPVLTWKGLLAVAATGAIGIGAVRWRTPGGLVAAALLVAPILPVLAVPYLPQRYLTVSYAGFLLLLALWLGRLAELAAARRRWVQLVGGALTIALLAVGAVLVRADLADYRRIAAAHQRLLDEAALVSHVVEAGAPVIVVRDEAVSPLHEVVGSPAGLPKLAFIRNHDPYGLIDTAALFEWVLAAEGTTVEHVASRPSPAGRAQGRLLIHRAGGFVDLGATPDLESEAERWRSSGRGLQVVRAAPLD